MASRDKYASAEVRDAIARFDIRRRTFARGTASGQWPYLPRVSQPKRRLMERRAK